MNSNNDEIEFDVFGFQITFKPSSENNNFSAAEIIEKVIREGEAIKSKSPGLDNGQLAILIALKSTADKMALENKFSDNIDQLRTEATDALNYIKEISQTSL